MDADKFIFHPGMKQRRLHLFLVLATSLMVFNEVGALAQARSIQRIVLTGNGQEAQLFDRSRKQEEACRQLPITLQLTSELEAEAPYDRSSRTHTLEFTYRQQFLGFTLSTRDGYAGLVQYGIEQGPESVHVRFLPQAVNPKPEVWYPAKTALLHCNCSGIATRSLDLMAKGSFTLSAYDVNDTLLIRYEFQYSERGITIRTNNGKGVKLTAETRQTNNGPTFGSYAVIRRFEIPPGSKTMKVKVPVLGIRERPNLTRGGITEVAQGDTIVYFRMGPAHDPSPWCKVIVANGEPIEGYVAVTDMYPPGKIVPGGNVTKAASDPQPSGAVSGRTRAKKKPSSTLIHKKK